MNTCGATTERGTPCRLPAKEGQNYCTIHGGGNALPTVPGELPSSRRRRERLNVPRKWEKPDWDYDEAGILQRIRGQDRDLSPKVYVIQMGETGPIKIGITQKFGSRLAQLQNGNPEQLHVRHLFHIGCGVHAVEQYLHQLCAEYAIRGEWFEADALKLIEKICQP